MTTIFDDDSGEEEGSDAGSSWETTEEENGKRRGEVEEPQPRSFYGENEVHVCHWNHFHGSPLNVQYYVSDSLHTMIVVNKSLWFLLLP